MSDNVNNALRLLLSFCLYFYGAFNIYRAPDRGQRFRWYRLIVGIGCIFVGLLTLLFGIGWR